MTLRETAYNTTACNGFLMEKTAVAIVEASIHGYLKDAPGSGVLMVEGGYAAADAIPPFFHPMLVKLPAAPHPKNAVVVDMRPFGAVDKSQNSFRVRNRVEYQLALHRAHLNQIWISQSPSLLRDLSKLPLTIFASWVSENVAKRYALDPAEQLKLAIYTAVFYLSNFMPAVLASEKQGIDEHDKTRFAAAISQALHCKAQDVLKVLDEETDVEMMPGVGCPLIANTIHFCNIVSGISVRMKEFNTGVLFSILGGTWFGANAREMVAVALEHPPTWLAILLAAYNERTYNNSGITKLTERKSNRAAGEDYVRSVLSLLKAYNS